jgi:hypothetical protein
MGWLFFSWRSRCLADSSDESLVAVSVDRVKSQVGLVVGNTVKKVGVSHYPATKHEAVDNLRQDSEGVGVTQTALPALDGNDGLVGPDDTHVQSVLQPIPDSVVDVDLPLSGGDASGLGVVDGVDTSVQVALSSGEFVSGDCESRYQVSGHVYALSTIETYHR